jgi:hypothetical protein
MELVMAGDGRWRYKGNGYGREQPGRWDQRCEDLGTGSGMGHEAGRDIACLLSS